MPSIRITFSVLNVFGRVSDVSDTISLNISDILNTFVVIKESDSFNEINDLVL